jgi:hypothetical protein
MMDMQDTERDLFKRMSNNDQIMALFDMTRYVRAEIASTKRAVLDLGEDLRTYRQIREKSEKHQSTTQKIQAIMDKRDVLKWFVDKVLPAIITTILIALLYLAFKTP